MPTSPRRRSRAIGIERPVAVLGDAMVPVSGQAALVTRAARVSRVSDAAIAIDAPKAGVLNFFIGLVVLLFGATALVLSLSRADEGSHRGGSASARLQALLLLTLSVPLAGLAHVPGDAPAEKPSGRGCIARRRRRPWCGCSRFLFGAVCRIECPWRASALGLTLVIVLDQLAGAPLSAVGFFSYSPLLGARFYGMGNEAAALLLRRRRLWGRRCCFDQWPEARWSLLGRRWGLPALGVVVVGCAAAPFFGANVGVAVWALAGFACAWMLMNGRAFGVKEHLVDRGSGGRRDRGLLGDRPAGGRRADASRARAWRAPSRVGSQSSGRSSHARPQTNIRVLSSTNWSWILVASLAFLGFARFRRDGGFAEFCGREPVLLSRYRRRTGGRRDRPAHRGLGDRHSLADHALRRHRTRLARCSHG